MNNNLKNRREEIGLTQVQVADKAGITEAGYQRYEYSKRVPNAYVAQLIARTLGSTVEELFPLPEQQFRKIKEKPDSNQAK